MKKITFKYYTDPAHGWIAVKRKLLEQYMPFSEVTCYSYVKGKTVYLEEDYDAPRLMNRLREAGMVVIFENRHTNGRSPIRNYSSVS